MVKTLFVLLVLDVALLGGWLLWVRPTPDVAIIEVYAIPLLAVFNALVGAGWWLSKRPRVAGAFFINALLAGVIFHLLLQSWYDYDRQGRYHRYAFIQQRTRYVLTLHRKAQAFDLSDVTNQANGSTTSLRMGDYVVRHDTVFLREGNGPRQYVMHQRTLSGFEGSTAPIPLRLLE